MDDAEVPTGESTALELLDIIKRYADLTVPELIARIAEEPATLVQKLEQLTGVGLVKLDQRALDELRTFVGDINRRMMNSSLRDRRAELLKQTAQNTTHTRYATLTAAPG